MAAPREVLDLVERYERNRHDYESGVYNETQLRREFLDPFLKALGWDVDNTAGYAEAYKDVVHEDAIRIEGSPKAPDYSVRIGGARKFFVEAKKPALKIQSDAPAAYQLRRYGWSAGLPLSVLTNFATWAAYDCRIPPTKNERPAKARILLVKFDEYDERWNEIAEVFSREAVLRGDFDRYVVSARSRRGTAPIDDYFLGEIEAWREELAADLARRNRRLTQAELNYAVQSTLDRVIFLRICEDRGLEDYGALQEAAGRRGVYARLQKLFQLADARYDSGLFHFHREPGRGAPDLLTPDLRVNDELLRRIISRLYFPDSPYEFSVISAEILGQVYEQFLGKVVRLLPGRAVEVEEKPEIRRAGGVYYTPAYIVRFIVTGALTRALDGVTPEAFIRGGKRRRRFRVLDPACGSGSFLIAAYQHMLDWYLDYYAHSDPEKWSRGGQPRIFQDGRGRWRLTTSERKRILLDHVYGVDIDSQAVEVTKLSLLLKVLEGENRETLQLVLRVTHERALPDLDNNIKCGNSLVGTDVLNLLPDLDDETVARINPFDWDAEFPDADRAGGFDLVVGNPPYVYRNATEEVLPPYYAETYDTVQGNFDLYKFFLERGLGLTRQGGRLGFIVSASFLVQPTFSRLRGHLLSATVEQLAPLGPGAFSKATIDSTILIVRKNQPQADSRIEIRAPRRPTDLIATEPYEVPQSRFHANPEQVFDYRLDEFGAAIVDRLHGTFPSLETGFEFGVGINTGFVRGLMTADEKVDDRYHPMVSGSGIARFGSATTDGFIMYDADFIREQGDRARSLPQERFFTEPKILIVRTRNLALAERVIATLDRSGAYNLNRLSNIIARPDKSLVGLVGILNSTLFRWLFSTRYYDYEVKPVYLRACPMADTEDADLNRASGRLLELTPHHAAATTAGEEARLGRQIAAAERSLEEAVWRLYAITAEERRHIQDQVSYFAEIEPPDAGEQGFALTLAAREQQQQAAA